MLELQPTHIHKIQACQFLREKNMLPFMITHEKRYSPESCWCQHSIGMELVVYLTGNSILRTPKNIRHMQRGAVCLIPPESVTVHMPQNGSKVEYLNFLFLESQLHLGNLSLTELPNWKKMTQFQGTGRDQISPVFYLDNELVDEIQNIVPKILTAQTFRTPGWKFYCSGAILYLLSRIIGEIRHDKESSDTVEHKIEQSISYIDQHCSQPLTLKMLADKVMMSPSSYSHHFKAIRKISPVEYLIQCRLQKAMMLFDRHYEIKQIAKECGFNEQAYFSRMFRKYSGLSPSQFQELSLQDQLSIRNKIFPHSHTE